MAKPRDRRKLAAILAADVVAYSRLMEADEAGTLTRLKAARNDVVDPTIERYGGRIVKTTGDGMLCEFPSVVDAVQCAVDIQSAMAERDAEDSEETRLRFRVGVNLGDIIIDGDDIFGDGVNIAARLEALAEPGGVSISGIVREEISNKLEIEFEDSGEQRVKNIERPIHVWRWRAAAETVDGKSKPSVTLRSDKPSIAVLTFDNMSGDPGDEFFGDGIAEDVITALSKISTMRVIARNSTFAYKGQSPDVRKVARELDVRYVLEGSIRRGGNRLRITAQLIDAADGSHIWADRYDRVVEDVFDIQDEITKEIVTALRVKLTDGEEALVWSHGTDNVEAWQLCVRATELFMRFNTSDYPEVRKLAERAVELDPNYAHAVAVLGFSHWWDGRLGYTGDTEKKFKLADEYADRAMALDDTVSWAIGLKAQAAAALGQHEKGVEFAERNVALFPGNADVRAFLGLALTWATRHQDAIETMRAAMDLNPKYPVWYMGVMARTYAAIGENEKALEFADRTIARDPGYFQAYLVKASVLVAKGRLQEARKEIDQVRKIAPQLRANHLRFLTLYPDESHVASLAAQLIEAGLPE